MQMRSRLTGIPAHRLDAAFTVSLFALVSLMVGESRAWPWGARVGPLLIGVITVLVLAAVLVNITIVTRREHRDSAHEEGYGGRPVTASGQPPSERYETPPRHLWAQVAKTVVGIIGIAVLIVLLGFRVGAPVATFGYLLIIARERLLLSSLFGLGTFLAVQAIVTALNLRLPVGQIFRMV